MPDNIPVVYEDDALLIVNKPPGLLTTGSPKQPFRHLTLILNEDAKKEGKPYRLYPCHRLDRETSGLVIYAKGRVAQQRLMEMFRKHMIHKTYHAFAHGRIGQDTGIIRIPLEGKSAVTRYRVVRRCAEYSIVEVITETGRKNQIRLHFKGIGHPLVGESKFIFRKDYSLRAKRVCLHAAALSFQHPVSGKHLQVECELARDMKKFLLEHA